MHVTYKGRIAVPADLRDGSIFLADFGDGPVVRAVKASYVSPSGIHGGKIVTVGPFRDEDEGKPGAYEPSVIRQLAVIDVTDCSPSASRPRRSTSRSGRRPRASAPGWSCSWATTPSSAAGSTRTTACGSRRT